jgi:hypothetical protein
LKNSASSFPSHSTALNLRSDIEKPKNHSQHHKSAPARTLSKMETDFPSDIRNTFGNYPFLRVPLLGMYSTPRSASTRPWPEAKWRPSQPCRRSCGREETRRRREGELRGDRALVRRRRGGAGPGECDPAGGEPIGILIWFRKSRREVTAAASFEIKVDQLWQSILTALFPFQQGYLVSAGTESTTRTLLPML